MGHSAAAAVDSREGILRTGVVGRVEHEMNRLDDVGQLKNGVLNRKRTWLTWGLRKELSASAMAIFIGFSKQAVLRLCMLTRVSS